MRCEFCDTRCVDVEMTMRCDRVTLRSCGCSRRWYKNGTPINLDEVLATVPGRRPYRTRAVRQAELLAA